MTEKTAGMLCRHGVAMAMVVAALSACTTKSLSNRPLSFYSPPTEGPTASVRGESKSTGFFGTEGGVYVQSIFSASLPKPLDSMHKSVQVPTGNIVLGIGYSDWRKVAGTTAFFDAEVGGEYQIRMGINTSNMNALNKALGIGQPEVWVEEIKSGKIVSGKQSIYPTDPDRTAPIFLPLPKK